MPGALQHTLHAQRLRHLKVVYRIPDHHGPGGIRTACAHKRKPDLDLAFGVNIAQPQQAVKIGQNVSLAHLPFQRGHRAGGQDHLPHPRGAKRFQRIQGAVRQGAAFAGRDIILHIAFCQLGKAVAGKIKPGTAVIVLDRKTKNRPVLLAGVLLRIAEPCQKTVERVLAQVHIIQQSTVPIPQNQFRAHRSNLLFFCKDAF